MPVRAVDQPVQPLVVLGIQSPELIQILERHLVQCGCRCLCARDSKSLEFHLRDSNLDGAIVDLTLGDVSTIAKCQQHSHSLQNVPVLCCISEERHSIEEIVAAVRAGASDVMVGPVDPKKLKTFVAEAIRVCNIESEQCEHARLNSDLSTSKGCSHSSMNNGKLLTNDRGNAKPASNAVRNGNGFGGADDRIKSPEDVIRQLEQMMLGSSAEMKAIRRTIAEIADTKATVMIYGESGTGKELVATAIHRFSRRSNGPFVAVNMAAIPEGLAESLLFGHEKGAFTSAIKQQTGHCESAHGGTLFLDEISEMELQIQPKLLRFLQSGGFQRVGSNGHQVVDARIISATNCDPQLIVKEGRLREDLYFRLHVVPIHVPPLRKRTGDIEHLATAFLQRASELHERPLKGFTSEALELLCACEWPGNVRQLENIVERMVIFSRGPFVTAEEVPAEVQARTLGADTNSEFSVLQFGFDAVGTSAMMPALSKLRPIQLRERAVIVEALQRADGHVVDAAELLGLGQATVYRKIKQYAIPHVRKRRRVLK